MNGQKKGGADSLTGSFCTGVNSDQMGRRQKKNILTGVELGTADVKVVMGEFLSDQDLSIVGAARVSSLHKILKGAILNAPAVQEQLAQALEICEKEAGQEIQDVFLALTGSHIDTTTSPGNAPVQGADQVVSEDEVVAAVRNARNSRLSQQQFPINSIDRRFLVDDTREVANPIGQVGRHVQAEVHIIFGDRNRVQTSRSLLAEVLGYEETACAFSAVADVFALLSEEEQRQGGMVIDIGAGVTEYAVFHGPGCFHSGQITVGCQHIHNDLATAFRLPISRAVTLLHSLGDFGSAIPKPDGRKRPVAVGTSASGKDRLIPASTVEQVVELRLQELFEAIADDLRKNNATERISRGIVLCGGGARIPGIKKLVHNVFKMPVRVGFPPFVSGRREIVEDPGFATTIGLLRFGRKIQEIDREEPGLFEQLGADAKHVWDLARKALRW